MAEKATYKALDINVKIRILDELKRPNVKRIDVARKFGIPKSTLSTFVKQEGKIQKNFAESHMKPNSGHKHFMSGKSADVGKELYNKWLIEKRKQDALVDGRVLMSKAKSIAEGHGETHCQFGEGWLRGFKDRYGIVFKKAHGEKAVADTAAAEDWLSNRWPELEAAYDAANIWNTD